MRVTRSMKPVELPGCCCASGSEALTTPVVRTGRLHLIVPHGGVSSKRLSLPVSVTVYDNGRFDHYAVIQKDSRRFGNSSVYVSLRNSRVVESESDKQTFSLCSSVYEGASLVFRADSMAAAEDWVESFRGRDKCRGSGCPAAPNLSPAISRNCLLPTLTEEAEEV